MGNENSKSKESIKHQNGKNVEPHVNGEVNGLKLKSKLDQTETDSSNVKAPLDRSEDVPVIPAEAQKPEVPASEVSGPHPDGDTEDNGAAEGTPSDPPPEPAETAAKQDSESPEEPKSVSIDLAPGQTHNTDDPNSQPVEGQEENNPEKNPVMNFFKTLVIPTKSQKKETATPDVTKDQPPKETAPTVTSTTVAQVPEPPAAPKGMSIPPPPPPEPPKMEIKGEPAVRGGQKPSPKEGPKTSAKKPEAAKGKSAKSTLGGFFRSKQAVEEVLLPVVQAQDTVQDEPEPELEVKETMEYLPHPVDKVQQTVEEAVPQPVVEKVDASKTTTLEADVKTAPASPAPEAKNPPSKSFFSLFKPKAQKRNSIDAGVQTEPAAAASTSEKTK